MAWLNKSENEGRATKGCSACGPRHQLGWGLFSILWIMKPRTVYEKAVQDFTQTARLQATLNQHFRQASFAEFEMLMGLDDEVLKRYGLPRPILERALIEVYRTVVLNQEKSRPLDHDVDANEWWCRFVPESWLVQCRKFRRLFDQLVGTQTGMKVSFRCAGRSLRLVPWPDGHLDPCMLRSILWLR